MDVVAVTNKQFFNIEGAKFLWWTWHDTDAPVRDRLFGAPVGSSCWVFTFSGKAFVSMKNLSTQNIRMQRF